MSEEQPERIATILGRIETILLRIADQMDIELSEAESTAACLRKTKRHQCACRAAEVIGNRAYQDKGPAGIVDSEAL
jgi:hypothetical protein